MIFVNQEPIDPALIEDAFQRIKTHAELLTEVSCCERDDEFLAQAEQEVIDGILLAQEAERRFPKLDPERVKAAMEKALRHWRENGASWELIESHHSAIHQETTASLRMECFTEEIFCDISEPSEEEIAGYFQDHSSEFFVAPAVHALHLLRFPDHAQPWQEYAFLLDLRNQVISGADFATLAREHTQKSTKEIDLDWVPMERILHPFEAILFSLKEKEISPIISHENALHLVYPLAVKPAELPPLEEKREEIRHRLISERKQAILKNLAQELRAQATIERQGPSLAGPPEDT
jgi:hypothetical protein